MIRLTSSLLVLGWLCLFTAGCGGEKDTTNEDFNAPGYTGDYAEKMKLEEEAAAADSR